MERKKLGYVLRAFLRRVHCRRIRQCRAELRKFMRNVKKGNPAATVLIWESYHHYHHLITNPAARVAHLILVIFRVHFCNFYVRCIFSMTSYMWTANALSGTITEARWRVMIMKWCKEHIGKVTIQDEDLKMVRIMMLISGGLIMRRGRIIIKCMMIWWKGDRAVGPGCWPWQWTTWICPW